MKNINKTKNGVVALATVLLMGVSGFCFSAVKVADNNSTTNQTIIKK